LFNNGNEANKTILPKGDDDCTQVNFNFSLSYYGNVYNRCCISINGYISFDDMTNSYYPVENFFIAPFDNDLDSTKNGTISYRKINDPQTLSLMGQEISSLYYLDTLNFIPTSAFIVTWDSVAPYEASISGNVSFQAILSTNGSNSFLTINYGKLDFGAEYGYYFQNGSTRITISKTNPMFSSNVGVNGKWIYHLSNLLLLKIKIN
jgi:hypothetical protein